MFQTIDGKRIGDAILWESAQIRQTLGEVFERSILGVGSEVTFFRNLIREVAASLNALSSPGVKFTCRTKETHQKPRVRVTEPREFSCELADLLVVVKYRRGTEVLERSSILYQVKMCTRDTSDCSIDPNQLELLCDWPAFVFGLLENGGPREYQIEPHTLEFGSYLLVLRAPQAGHSIPCQSHYCHVDSYGVAPHALAVRRRGPKTVELSEFPYATNAYEALFSHIALETGEHHALNPEVEQLVSALYRHLGLDPDPPGEFDGFVRETGENEPGFALIEITVEEGEEMATSQVRQTQHTKWLVREETPLEQEKKRRQQRAYQEQQRQIHLRQQQ